MKRNLLLSSALLALLSTLAYAGPVLVTGTPGDDLLATPTGPSPNLNNLLLTFSTSRRLVRSIHNIRRAGSYYFQP